LNVSTEAEVSSTRSGPRSGPHAQTLREFEPVDFAHAHIDDREVGPGAVILREARERGRPRGLGGTHETKRFEHVDKEIAINAVIVDDQHATRRALVAENAQGGDVGHDCRNDCAQRHGKREGAADARAAFDDERSAHPLDQSAADGQSKAGAGHCGAGGPGLFEGLKKVSLIVAADARPRVGHREPNAQEIL
jgi:hypothetical protein